MSNDTAITSIKEKIDDLNQNAWEVRVTDLPKSFELSQESVKLARRINYPKGLAEGLRSLGFSYVRYSKNDEAAPLLKESLSLYQSLNDLKGQAVVYEYLGIIERNWGNLGASLDLLLKANKLVLQIDSQEIEITCSYQLGVTYKHLGDHENALDYLYKTLSLAKKMNFTLMEAYATNIIGSIYFDNGNYNQALDCYRQGLIIRQQSHDKWGEAGSLDNIGFTYLKLNDLDKAIDHCKQSLTICQATGDKKGEANALLHLGEIYEQAGDIKQAAGFSNESLEIRKARGDKRGEIEVLLFLADLYKNRNDVEDHQIFEWLSNALKIADEVKAQDLLSKTHYNLHEYYQQKGNFKESLVQLEAHFQIEKELHKNSINQKIANLEISHKAEVISQRNKELTELNEKIEKANEELKIEASLEKIRSRSLAMHKSDELKDVITVVFEKLKELGLVFEDVGIYLFTEGKKDSVIWVAAPVHLSEPILVNLPYSEKIFEESEIFRDYWMAKEKGENTFNKTYSYNDKNRYFDYLEKSNKSDQVPVSVREFQMQAAGYTATLVTEKHSALWIDSWSGQTISIEGFNVLKKVARVFEQAYTRFLDLQKAEAQTRESQIELALERVRARTMAMQKSDELREAVLVIYEQLQQLNFDSKACNIIIIDKESGSARYWVSGFSQEIFPESYTVPYLDHPYFDALLNPWKQGDKYVVYDYTGKMKQSFDELFFTQTEFRNIPEEAKKVMIGLKSVKLSTAFISYGALQSIGAEPLSEEKANILKRFAKVFEQTYTRFLDLQKAEAQAREAQIETALEKVRSRTMAMQKGEELNEVAVLLYKELIALGVTNFVTCGYVEINEKINRQFTWVTSPGGDSLGLFYLPLTGDATFDERYAAWKRQQIVFQQAVGGEVRSKHLEYAITTFNSKEAEEMVRNQFPDPTVFYCFNFSHGYLHLVTGSELKIEEEVLLARFTRVFEQTYARFLDLKKAEAQARESQIEAALEKVRSRSLAMHTTNELGEVVTVIVEKLKDLGVVLDANGVVLCTYFQNSKNVLHWIVSPDYSMAGHYLLPYFDHPIFNAAWQSKENGDEYFSKAFSVEEKNSFFEHAFEHSDYRHFPDEFKKWIFQNDQHILSFAWQKNSAILIPSHTGVLPSEADVAILKRFSKVFEQSYVRFLDLQKAEAQAREAQIEAALERIRSKTMGMQKSEELKDVIQVVYEQFVHLNVHVEHTGFIMDYKERSDMHIWLADKHAVPFQVTLPYFDCAHWNSFNEAKEKGMDFFANKLSFEQKNKFYQDLFKLIPDLPEETLKYYFSCPGLAISTVLLDNVGLYIENFSGLPYSDEENATLMRFGKVFQQTYTRFNDLKLAEAHAVQAEEDLVKLQTEKKRAEDALSELQVTQKQLIQSEKMASLGELTAGIAHEIQNPLNFVNNFSDVNKELLVEMKEEIEKGNTEEVIAIANDIISNEEKINHHGKRADAIVKGMLQHSRSSSGIKEPTDINELVDEYLRLAYHGLRAKDKSFNATMKTDFDEAVGKINIVPQEIGRAVLNLITNAFYVVSEKKKQLANGYEPTVTVTTKKESDKVVVSVKDNGNGIPQKVLDKIFQPFFTTKPTGQGTGLGLSLSYDIVKAHSGEIKVSTRDGEGSEFVIQLPIGQQ